MTEVAHWFQASGWDRHASLARNGRCARFMGRAIDYVGGLALALVWLRSSAAHLSNPYQFLSTVYHYELVGPTVGQFVAIVLPFIQVVLVICLIGRMYVGGAFLLSGILLMLFATVQVSAWIRELGISCGCFGASTSSQIGAVSITSTLLLLLLAALAGACHLSVRRASLRDTA